MTLQHCQCDVGREEDTCMAKSRRAMSATGVRLRRLVTSPMAQMLGTLVRLKRSTLIAPVFSSSSTPACAHSPGLAHEASQPTHQGILPLIGPLLGIVTSSLAHLLYAQLVVS